MNRMRKKQSWHERSILIPGFLGTSSWSVEGVVFEKNPILSHSLTRFVLSILLHAQRRCLPLNCCCLLYSNKQTEDSTERSWGVIYKFPLLSSFPSSTSTSTSFSSSPFSSSSSSPFSSLLNAQQQQRAVCYCVRRVVGVRVRQRLGARGAIFSFCAKVTNLYPN